MGEKEWLLTETDAQREFKEICTDYLMVGQEKLQELAERIKDDELLGKAKSLNAILTELIFEGVKDKKEGK